MMVVMMMMMSFDGAQPALAHVVLQALHPLPVKLAAQPGYRFVLSFRALGPWQAVALVW